MPQQSTETGRPLPDWQPAALPQRTQLQGGSIRLLPLDAERDAAALYQAEHAADADPSQWDFLTAGPFQSELDFSAWLKTCAVSSDPFFYTVIDQQSGLATGVLSYLAITPEHGSIEIGHIWFSGRMQRSRQATEAIYLLARHAFEVLGYRRLEWKCNSLNQRSQQAALRFGFTPEGLFRQHRVFKGKNRDTAWFSMLDSEWPLQRAIFEAWLQADNFDAEGRQKKSLNEIRAALS
ncbi:Protein export cytoplasm protein SecA ATPase RNA helicase [Collimonas arenae]|uniref:Protein export cytoplasm protein SecA ATPase RNA helicase n=1 Tax=Collimonas arenae TaxID=279058 RepID=A0A0A1FGJ8_9BURK|nr:GNAT family protein [Collimonas arenae]AIY43898.1 Protein export cytoplasm protein SecA ATPase RNA helicase [Collimonas arenae]